MLRTKKASARRHTGPTGRKAFIEKGRLLRSGGKQIDEVGNAVRQQASPKEDHGKLDSPEGIEQKRNGKKKHAYGKNKAHPPVWEADRAHLQSALEFPDGVQQKDQPQQERQDR